MTSITMMIIAMLFTFRVIQIGPLQTPGAVFIFAMTYTVADIITEVYGFKMVRQVIWATFFCIVFFNLLSYVLIALPTPPGTNYDVSYDKVFGHSFRLLFGFSISFLASDFLNAYAINRWRILLKGRYFWLRSIGSSAVGETLFGIIAAVVIYLGTLPMPQIAKLIISTWMCKISVALIVAYPSTLIVEILRRAEGIKKLPVNDEDFCEFSFVNN
jgi:queuosine precursor transporter